MTFRTTMSNTTMNYIVEFEDNSISLVEGKDLNNTAAEIGSTVRVQGKYNAILIASGE